MLNKGLVSIISPCYNVAPYLPLYFNSLLKQTYKYLEIILVNDGSTDTTHDVITSWLPKLEAAGYLIKYIVKENGGQSSAINAALPFFTGEFLTWPDSDDWLYPDSIKKRVDFLVQYPDFALVRSGADICHENDPYKITGNFRANTTNMHDEKLFRDLIFSNTYFTPICYMVRSSSFLEVIPSRSIYERKDAGQNWQMLLPLAANYKCAYLPESLCCYMFRKNSHSHASSTLEEKLRFLDMCVDVTCTTLKSIGFSDPVLEKELEAFYSVKRCRLGFEFKDQLLIHKELKYLYHMGRLSSLQKLLMVLSSMRIVFKGILVPILWLNRHPIYIVEKLI